MRFNHDIRRLVMHVPQQRRDELHFSDVRHCDAHGPVRRGRIEGADVCHCQVQRFQRRFDLGIEHRGKGRRDHTLPVAHKQRIACLFSCLGKQVAGRRL